MLTFVNVLIILAALILLAPPPRGRREFHPADAGFWAALIPLISTGVSAVSSWWQARKARKAAESAAALQSSAALRAGERSDLATQSSLDTLTKTWNANRGSQQPYMDAGALAARSLFDIANEPASSAPVFAPPTAETFTTDPGYQFRLREGTRAYENSAAARGTLASTNTLQGIARLGQEFASNEFSNVYNRSLSTYGANLQGYIAGQQARQQRFGNLFSVANLGQGASTTSANLDQQYASLWAQIQSTGASQYGNWLTQGANAGASGIVGANNASNAAIASATSNANATFAQMYQAWLDRQNQQHTQ